LTFIVEVMPDSGHSALCGPCSGLCGAAGHLVAVRFQCTLNFPRRILGCFRHFQDCCCHDLVQGFGLVFVETGAGNMLDAAAKGRQLIDQLLKRILAHG
jgi:hypothetical protein